MSGNSLASLLAWMKDSSRLLGWGLVVALARRKTNLIVLQEYIKRFGDNSYLPPIRGEVPIVENRRMELMHDFVMDVPVLSFENADLNDSKAMLTMAVMGGSQLTLEKESVGWKAYKVDEIDPLQGPKLHLDLLLNEVPGDVDKDGRVKLDLSKSDNFRLTFAETQHEQRMGGDFFKDLFNQLPDAKRIYPLGKIEQGTNDLMRPQSFELRTQASSSTAARDPKSSEYGDGAVLAFVRMAGRMGGNFPGAGFKYLIPDDQGKDYSATVMFERTRISSSVLMDEIAAVIQGSNFNYIYDADGGLIRSVSEVGELVVPAGEFRESAETENGDIVEMVISYEEWKMSVVKPAPLVVELAEGNLSVRGSLEGDVLMYVHLKDEKKFFAKLKGMSELLVKYELVSEKEGYMSLRQTQFVSDLKFEYLDFGAASPSADNESDPWFEFVKSVIIGLLMIAFYPKFKAILEAAFEEVITGEASINAYIQEIIKLNFGQAIQGNEIYAPEDIGFFGRINPQQTSFLINPMQPVIKAGSPQPFATTPVVAGVQWKVENLVEGPGSPGTITSSGVYTAPAASTIKGRFTRVRVTATAPGTGYYSSALVTVVVDELSVHPLIQICDLNATVELSAGVLGEGQLQWSIKNPVPGESGEIKRSVKPEGDHTYHHGPVVANKTYVLDQIEVKNTRTGGTRSVHVLALQKAPGTTVEIRNTNIAQGQVQLQAIVNGTPMDAQWSLPSGGPGTIDQAGLYRAAPSATERFVLIFALIDGGPFGKFEGHLILPLPLIEFPHWLEVMSHEYLTAPSK